MSALVSRTANGGTAVAPSLSLPALPPRVAAHMAAADEYRAACARHAAAIEAGRFDEAETLPVGVPPRPLALADHERAECQAAAAHMARLTAPPAPELIAAWLWVVNRAVRNPQDPKAYADKCAALAELLGDTPAGAYTADARRRLSGDWFPSAGEVRTAIAPEVASLKARAAALKAAAAPPPKAPEPPPAPQGPRTLAELAHVRDTAQAFVAQARAGVATVRDDVRPAYVHPADLLAQYELLARAGNKAAATRAEALRAALSTEAQAHD